jgi:DNA-binding LacI/PurR family transcriptional regulator
MLAGISVDYYLRLARIGYTRIGYIGLTTIDNNYGERGRLAVLRLVERIAAPHAPRTITLLDPSLASRSTVARLD